MEIIDDGSCFVCGKNNECGLKLRFKLDREAKSATTTTVLKDHFSGWVNAAHGGIICALLDEAMVYACAATGWFVATGNMNVKFRKPVPVGETLTIEGELLEHRRKMMKTRARVLKDGEVLAESEGTMVVVGEVENEQDYAFVN
ncbi:PaaI family thioesterase [Verrucomicrobiota bacterium]